MKNQKALAVVAALVASITAAQSQNVITAWSFDAGGVAAAPYNSPAPTVGTGTASVLGMNNTYNSTTSSANADVLASTGASTGSGSFGWRIRGTPGNGWSSQAPIATQGAEFATSTIGYDTITISVDINTTAQAERNLAILYTLDATVGSPVWVNATLTSAGSVGSLQNNSTSANTITGNFVQLGSGWNNLITASLPNAGGNANLAIEIVNASTGVDAKNISGTAYNNTSGNWRYDNISFSGTPVPEPSALALVGIGLTTLIAFRRKLKV